jgi:YD repeat-containing protein
MNGLTRGLFLALCLICATPQAEDEQRDFYAEPGLNPFATASGQDATEHIDPFSGNLQRSYVDLFLPGNGGLDIEITRYYNLPQGAPGYGNPFGYGWTMHFGRITIGSGHASLLCGTGATAGGDTLDNPSIEMPDGGRELLVHSAALGDGTYITKSNWKAGCIDPADHTQGLVVTAPDGTRYFMREYVFMQGEDGPAGEPAPAVETWLTNRIVDARGNSIDMTYLEIASGMKLVTRLDSSDGREVVFHYLEPGDVPVTPASTNARLAAITANGQTWSYEYAPIEGGRSGWGTVHHYKLAAVVRPDGTRWQYAYGSQVTDPEYNRLVRVTYPAGGVVNYRYQWVQPYLPSPDLRIIAVREKTQENPGHPTGTWRWAFHPGHTDFAELGVQPLSANAGRMADFTRITTPTGEEHVYHVGYWALADTHDLLWEMGLKLVHRVFAPDSGSGLRLVRAEGSAWDRRVVSGEVYRGGILSALWDEAVYAPVLTRRTVTLDGHSYAIDYADYDGFGNPGTTTEWAIYPSEGGNRVTERRYLNDEARWFIGLPLSESVLQDGSLAGVITRGYDARGQLVSEDRFGVVTQYSYTPEGDLASITDALGNTTGYSDYHRGQARREDRPDGTHVTRAINATGTLASRTSGRGYTTAFTYDGLNRLTGIDYPRGHGVAITWGPHGKSLTRGPYREEVYWDGFGREVEIIRHDLDSGDSFARHFRHDALGRRVFESDINTTRGVAREFDAADRLIQIVNQDGTASTVTHDGAHREIHRDENGNDTELRFQVYGSPENRYLSWVVSPESVGTRIARDPFGHVTEVFQGGRDPVNPEQFLGYTQTYGYNERLQLIAIDSPADVGLTAFGRDAVGNMTSRQVGDGDPVGFEYDAMNRVVVVDYLDDSLDVSYRYDEDGNPVEIANAFATRSYHYDSNGNLSEETVDIGGSLYPVTYTLDGLDHVATVHYPSGRSLDYAPDALGRPTRALPYLSSVSHFPEGSPRQLRYANGRVVDYTETERHRVDTIQLDTAAGYDYDYDPAGNVTAIADLSDLAASRVMTYDGLHRLTSAAGPWGTARYAYDAFGNLVRKHDPAMGNRGQYYHYRGLLLDRITYETGQAQRVFSHDDRGNVSYSDDTILDPFTGLPTEVLTRRQQYFDDAGNMTYTLRTGRDDSGDIVPLRSGSFSSEYDATNHRVRRIDHTDDNRATDYVYSRAGLLLGEYDEAGASYGHEYFYLGNQQIASAKTNAPPAAEVGEDRLVAGGSRVPLSASHNDLDGEVVAVEWTQLSGPAVTIADPYSDNTFFTAPDGGQDQSIVLQFTATDDRGGETRVPLTITVEAGGTPSPVSNLAALPGDGVNLVVWEGVPEAASYTVYWSADPASPLAAWNRVDATGRHFAHVALSNGTQYRYAVAAGSEVGLSEPGPVVAATPGPLQWQASRQVPDEALSFDSAATVVASNPVGDVVIVTDRHDGGLYRLEARRFSHLSGWSDPQVIDESSGPHQFLRADVDREGNLLAAWASGMAGERSLYAVYRPFGASTGIRQAVEHHSPDGYVDADVVGISQLGFTDAGQAYICWRQTLLHSYNNYYDPDGASALIKRFDPVSGWSGERNLEVRNNIGDTRHLSCDIAGNGRVVAAWERYNTYDPQLISFGGREYDVWVAAYDPARGWEGSETVEYLATGVREENGQGVHNRHPQAAASSAGAGAVVWFNETDGRIEVAEFDFDAARWLPQQVIEARSRRVTADNTQSIAANEAGDFLITWGEWYTTRPAASASWDRARSMPGLALTSGMDAPGRPYLVHLSGSDLVASRLEAGAWAPHTLNSPGDTGQKTVLLAEHDDTGAFSVHWLSGRALFLASNQSQASFPGDDSSEDLTPPVTAFSAETERLKGGIQYRVSLSTNEPAATLFRFTGQGTITAGGTDTGEWQPYQGPVSVQLQKRGEGVFEFYSRDTAGNVEAVREEVLI